MVGVNRKTQVLNAARTVFKWGPLERVLASLTQNAHPRSLGARMVPNNYQYPPGSMRRVSRFGIRYELDISDLVDWHVFYGLKAVEMSQLENLIQPGAVVIDVGANIGWQTLEAAKKVRESGQVYAFEPHPKNFKKLTRNISLNSFKNITSAAVGLSDTPGNALFGTDEPNNMGMVRVVESSEKCHASVSVPVTTLDAYFKGLPLSRLDLIKIDVEGLESNVLKGGLELITTWKPILFVEVNKPCLNRYGLEPQDLIRQMQELGYQVLLSHTMAPIPTTYSFERMVDVVALPRTTHVQ